MNNLGSCFLITKQDSQTQGQNPAVTSRGSSEGGPFGVQLIKIASWKALLMASWLDVTADSSWPKTQENIYIYICICVCVYVCVCKTEKRERERESPQTSDISG